MLPMAKVEIIGTKDKLDPTLKTLHRLGALQIEDVRRRGGPLVLPGMALEPAALAQREEIALLVTRLESLLALLPAQPLPENAPRAATNSKLSAPRCRATRQPSAR